MAVNIETKPEVERIYVGLPVPSSKLLGILFYSPLFLSAVMLVLGVVIMLPPISMGTRAYDNLLSLMPEFWWGFAMTVAGAAAIYTSLRFDFDSTQVQVSLAMVASIFIVVASQFATSPTPWSTATVFWGLSGLVTFLAVAIKPVSEDQQHE